MTQKSNRFRNVGASISANTVGKKRKAMAERRRREQNLADFRTRRAYQDSLIRERQAIHEEHKHRNKLKQQENAEKLKTRGAYERPIAKAIGQKIVEDSNVVSKKSDEILKSKGYTRTKKGVKKNGKK